MGLLLSILVFSVGVLEVIACARHIQYGYLPEWAPRRHVLATGTSGLTKLRDRWRKKPSRSVDFDNKTKKSGYDVSRSCDVPCYGGECHGPLSDKCGSLAEQSEDTSAADFISTDVGEFQLRYQEFEEVLSREANTSNIYEDSAIHRDYAVCGQCVEDVPAQVAGTCGAKIKQRPPNIENIVSEESENLHTRSHSPSPRKLKADISWPLFAPHALVSRRPSTPTTAEEDGGQSPYYCGEFLTEEHIRSTQRPLSIRTETYHADQDITPLLSIASEDGTTSISRPLTVTSHASEQLSGNDSMSRQKERACIPPEINSSVLNYETNESKQYVTNDLTGKASTIQAKNDIDVCSLSSRGSDSTDSTLMSTTEEEKANEACIKQKRRTSTTEYLPSHEEVAIISQKEVTPVEPIFAAQKEEPVRLKPVKTTGFEEARLETFISDPQFADTSVAPHSGARRSSILSNAPVTEISGEDDSSVVMGKVQVKTAKDHPQPPAISMGDSKGSWVTQVSTKNDDSAYPDGGKEKKDSRKRRLKFDLGPDDSDSDFTRPKVNDIKNSSECVLKFSDLYNITPTVEVTAITVVDKIIDEAVARVNKMKYEYLVNGSHWKIDHCNTIENLVHDDVIDVIELRNKIGEGTVPSNETVSQPEPESSERTTSAVYSDENTTATDSGDSRTMTSTPEEDVYNCGSVSEKAASDETEEMTCCGPETSKITESSSVSERHSKIDSKNTTSPSERTCEISNTTRSSQKCVKFPGSVSPSDRQKREVKITKQDPEETQTVNREADETTVCEGSVGEVQLSKLSTSANSITKGENSTKTDEITGCPSKNQSQGISPSSCTSQDRVSLRESDTEQSNNYLDSDHIQTSGNNSEFPITPKSNDDSKMSNSSKNTNRTTQEGVECDAPSSEKSVSDQQQQQQQPKQQQQQQKQQQSSESAPEAFWLIFSGEYTKAMSKDWHSGHFCCWQCDESLTGQRYVLRDDHPYCIKCYESVFANNCEECNRTIGIDSKDLSYKDKHWHEACFLCTKCRVSLVDKQFGSKADKIYCGNCYDAQFASRCDGCGEIFRAGTKKMEYKTRQWHEKCFCCCVCKTPIGTKSFIPREQEIYCATCYEEKFATRCVKCNKIITSGGVTYKNEPWHRECFTCTNCNTSLAGQRFTSRDEKPYCAECFGELFAKRCTSCSKPITGIGGTRFISFEDRHWHNDCFICASCKTSLVGRGFITDADDIICPECAKQKLM